MIHVTNAMYVNLHWCLAAVCLAAAAAAAAAVAPPPPLCSPEQRGVELSTLSAEDALVQGNVSIALQHNEDANVAVIEVSRLTATSHSFP